MKYKIGQYIRIKKTAFSGAPKRLNGTVGKIICKDENAPFDYRVRTNDGDSWFYDEKDLEPIGTEVL